MRSSLKLFTALLLSLLIATLQVQGGALQRREIQQNGNETAAAAEIIVTTMIPTPTAVPTAMPTAMPESAKPQEVEKPTPTPLSTVTAEASKPQEAEQLTQSSTTNQQQKEKFEKNVKIIFPAADDSEDESKFDIYGLKTTPKPKDNLVVITNATNTANLPLVENETTTIPTIAIEAANNNNNITTTNSTIKSVDDRLGIFNLAPRCPEGHVVVNQRCHKSV